MRRVSIIILSIVTVLVLFVVLCTYTKRSYEDVVLDRFGEIVQNPVHIAYGWYLKLPTDTAVRLDTRLHLHQTILSQVATAQGEPISVQAFAAWRIANPDLFYQRFQGSDTAANSQIDTKLTEHVAAVLGKHRLDELFNATSLAAASEPGAEPLTHSVASGKAEAMEAQIAKDVDAEMEAQGIQVVKVGFSRLAFPPSVADAVYKRMSQERETLAARWRAEGEAQAQQVRAKADAQAAATRAQAAQEAANIRGQGDSQALNILNDAQQTPDARNFYRFWREMELLKNSIGKGTYLVLRSDDSVLKQLFPMQDQQTQAAGNGQSQTPAAEVSKK